MRKIGIFGGTFDPVHYGHLRIALDVYEQLALDEVRFIPCAMPPHREQPNVTAAQRLHMVAVAIANTPGFKLDERELQRAGPSYTIDTLASLRAENPNDSLVLIMGSDSFNNLHTWHRWQEMLEYAHIAVAYRPGWQVDKSNTVADAWGSCFSDHAGVIEAKLAGSVVFCPVTQLEISATGIRHKIINQQSIQFLVPDAVKQVIEQQQLYQK
jgi:nicotinate-nucleotide adenylyltransferase